MFTMGGTTPYRGYMYKLHLSSVQLLLQIKVHILNVMRFCSVVFA